ncbi:MAG: extracellular solute-binding protein [Chloroflexi bacterium]|nr:extracellular solute-binding protein [Chloroflexota bacterium]MCY3938617.1 extracellular solute-binding protein [Chloroflexota bacterium]
MEVERVVTQIVEKEKIVEKIVTVEAMPAKVTPVEIVLWSFDPLHVKHFTQVASLWKDKWAQYDLTFDFLTVPFDELVTKLLANMSAGAELPDLTAIEIGQWSKFMKGDIAETQLVDLTPLIGDDRTKFIEGRWTPYIKDGKIYGAESVPSLSYTTSPRCLKTQASRCPLTHGKSLPTRATR